MSHRQAKKLRKELRANGIDSRDARYVKPRHNTRSIQTAEVKEKGLRIIKQFAYAGTLTLLPECGRAKYRYVQRELAVQP
jgi:hypothetical protein